MPDDGLRLDDLRLCVQTVLALGKDLDATSIAEALWLAAGSGGDAATEPAEPAVDETPIAQQGTRTADKPPSGSGVTRPGKGRTQPDAGSLVTGRRVRVGHAKPFPDQLELARSLRPFKRRWPRGRRMRLDIEATVRSYTRTWHLVPEFSPAPERWFEVVLVVDNSQSMSVWAEEVAGLSRVLRQTGAFKAIHSYRLSLTGTDGSPEPSPTLFNEGNRPHSPDQLRAHDGRRLIVVVTDGAAPGWHHAAMWTVIRTWATSTPTALVSPLATRLWRQTGLDLPAVRTGPAAPGSPNAMLKYSVPFQLQEPGQPTRAWLPVPAMTLSPARLGRWAKTLMRSDPIGCEALLIPATGRTDDDELDSDLPSDRDSASTFLRLAAPEAARLAVLSSLFEMVDLALLRLIRQELVPTASTADLAEVIVSSLFLPPTAAPNGELLRFREDARAALLDTLTESDAWQVYDMLRRHIDSHAGAAGTFPATVPDPLGDVPLPLSLLPFAEASRHVLDFLDVPSETGPVAEDASSAVDVAANGELPSGGVQIDQGNTVIEHVFTGSAAQTFPTTIVVGNLPQVPPAFQPRPDLLALLDQAGPGVSVITAVTGMRGVGKTQLAAEYARDKVNAGWRLVAWVNAQDAGQLLTALAAIADRLDLPAAATVEEASQEVRHWLEADGDRCLIVFDNVSDTTVLRPYLPAAGLAQVLITSTMQSAGDLGRSVLAVNVFTESEAVSFLTQRTGLYDTKGAAALAAELGYLPLSLAQAAGLIAAQRLSYQIYLDRLRRLPVESYLSRAAEDRYPRGLVAAVLLSLREVQNGALGSLCIALIETLALLSGTSVSRDLLHATAEGGTSAVGANRAAMSADLVDSALGSLADRSLLSFSLDGQAILGHPLVMRVVREDLIQRGRLKDAFRTAALVLTARARELVGLRDRAAVRDIPAQVSALLANARSAYGAEPDLMELVFELRSWAMYYLNELGDSWRQAVEFGEPLAADLERILGPDHPETLAALNNLANAYGAVGDVYHSVELYQRTLAGRERILGPDHADTLLSRGNLASAYQATGRIREAIALHQQTLAGLERVLGPEDPRTLSARNNLAIAYQDAGQIDKAVPLLQSALVDQERVLGTEHSATLNSLNNLAIAYQEAGRPADALPLLQRALRGREQLLGPDHPDTLAAQNNLAITLREVGQPGEALPLLQRTLAAREELLGPQHPATVTSLNNLAITLQELGRPADGLPLFERALATSEREFGADHPDTLISRNNLGSAYLTLGRATEAIPLYEQSVTSLERVLGPDHPDTQIARDNLTVAYRDAGRRP